MGCSCRCHDELNPEKTPCDVCEDMHEILQPEIHQGSELEEGNNFVVLICDIEDIKGRIEQNEQEVTEDQLKRIYDYAKRKMTDSVMDQFWYSIDAMIDEILLEDKLK